MNRYSLSVDAISLSQARKDDQIMEDINADWGLELTSVAVVQALGGMLVVSRTNDGNPDKVWWRRFAITEI